METMTAEWICGHLWVGGRLRIEDGRVLLRPNVGPHYWTDLEVPVSLMRLLLRGRHVRQPCRGQRSPRYYVLDREP
jgi:hypothetical protein